MLYVLFDACNSEQHVRSGPLTFSQELQVVLCFKMDDGFVLCLLEFAEHQQS